MSVTAARAALVLAVFAAVHACGTLRAEDVPALVTQPTAESHAELAATVSQALGGAPVTLADDALTNTSVLTIERRPPRDIEGNPALGRVLEPPEQFRLVLSGARCLLIHARTGERFELAHTTCRPA